MRMRRNSDSRENSRADTATDETAQRAANHRQTCDIGSVLGSPPISPTTHGIWRDAGTRTMKPYLAGQDPTRAAQKNKLRRLKFRTSFRHERCHVLFQPLVVPKCKHDCTSHDRSHRNGQQPDRKTPRSILN
jgi:hypothetical protein